MFNGPVKDVKETRIMVAETMDGKQFTAYQNYVTTRNGPDGPRDKDLPTIAMVLPFPLDPSVGDSKATADAAARMKQVKRHIEILELADCDALATLADT